MQQQFQLTITSQIIIFDLTGCILSNCLGISTVLVSRPLA